MSRYLLCPICETLVETHAPGDSYVKQDGAYYHPKCLASETDVSSAEARRVEYRAFRSRLIKFFAAHYLPPESAVEASIIANRLNEFAAEMDKLAADALTELEEQFRQAPRETELL